MTFFRHFVERQDFEVLVIAPSHTLEGYDLTYTPIFLEQAGLLKRVSRTRFLPWIYGWQCLYGDFLLNSSVIQAAKQFKPDAVFTVAGSWDWTALAAQQIAKRLEIPLIASFNDWFNYGWFPAHPRLHSLIEARFRRFYQEADLALCTSEGMREALGQHFNTHVLYPTGAAMPSEKDSYQPKPLSENPSYTVFFGGSLADWYGPMLESVIGHCQAHFPAIQFRIFGSRPTWSPEFDQWAKSHGVYQGQVSFEQLRQEASHADLLLLPMGFDATCAQVERTSFKTKFLDYLSFRRPILVWGPDYCSAVCTAREFDSAECVITPDPAVCARTIHHLATSSARRVELIGNAQKMYDDRFHPDVIHAGLVRKIRETVNTYNNKHSTETLRHGQTR